MSSDSAATVSPNGADALLQSFVGGERGRALRGQLASRHPGSSPEEIEDAVQYACKSFLDEAEGITAPGQVYAWIRTAAHRSLNREADHKTRELVVDPIEGGLDRAVSDDPSPEEELIAHEDEGDLETLVEEVASSLTPRRREVLALYGAGYKRPEIAARLGLTDRAVKRDLLEIMDEARTVVARRAGGGCERGEPLVLRFVYGLATPTESDQARLHLSSCRRCEVFCERIDAWRDKAGALLPLPVVEQASPGLLGRVAHRAADGLASVKQQVFGGGAQLKQQASSTYYRVVDPTPLAGARPGAVAALLVSCVTIGGGAATYCAQHGVDPLSAATGLIAGTEDESPPPPQPSSPQPEGPQYTPATPSPVVEEPTSAEPEQHPAEVEKQPSSVEKQSSSNTPPPEQSFEPASPDYPASESGGEYQATEPAPVEHARPTPVPAGESPQFGGP